MGGGFLAKMQDADSGFYFLVYPRNREYENDVPPENGDPADCLAKKTGGNGGGGRRARACSSSPLSKNNFRRPRQLLCEGKTRLAVFDECDYEIRQGRRVSKTDPLRRRFHAQRRTRVGGLRNVSGDRRPQYQRQLFAWFPDRPTRTHFIGAGGGCIKATATQSAVTPSRAQRRLPSPGSTQIICEVAKTEIIAAAQDQ